MRPAASERSHAPLVAALGAALLLGAGLATGYNTGPPPDRVGLCQAGPTCNDSGCHNDFPLASRFRLRLEELGPPPSPLPATYARGLLYRLLLTAEAPVPPVPAGFGFELAAVADCPFALPAGRLAVLDAERTQVVTERGIDYLEHACPGLPDPDPARCGFLSALPGENSWAFEWRAPCTGGGPIEIDYAVNGINHDGSARGDEIQLGRDVLLEAVGCPGRIDPLLLAKADCDLSTPGVLEAAASWPSGEVGALFAVVDRRDLATACGGPRELTSCLPMDGPPLVYYTVAALCADGTLGPL